MMIISKLTGADVGYAKRTAWQELKELPRKLADIGDSTQGLLNRSGDNIEKLLKACIANMNKNGLASACILWSVFASIVVLLLGSIFSFIAWVFRQILPNFLAGLAFLLAALVLLAVGREFWLIFGGQFRQVYKQVLKLFNKALLALLLFAPVLTLCVILWPRAKVHEMEQHVTSLSHTTTIPEIPKKVNLATWVVTLIVLAITGTCFQAKKFWVQTRGLSANVWAVYYDEELVLTWKQPDSQNWLRASGPLWALGARTGESTASMVVKNVKLVVQGRGDAAGTQLPACNQETALSMGSLLSSTPFEQHELAEHNYRTIVSPRTQCPIWGCGEFEGSITSPGTDEQVYQLTMHGVRSTSRYFGSTVQRLQDHSRFSISFDFRMLGGNNSADAIFFMAGAPVPDDTDEYISEDDGAGVKVVFDCYPHQPRLYNKAHIFASGGLKPAVSSESLKFYQQGSSVWHTVRVDYRKEVQQSTGPAANVWAVYYDGKPVVTWTQPDSQEWLADSGSFWVLGARTGDSTASMFVRHVQLVVQGNGDSAGAHSPAYNIETALSMGPATPCKQQELAARSYRTIVSPRTRCSIWGCGTYEGEITALGTRQQAYQFTENGVQSTSRYIGGIQRLQEHQHFSISFHLCMDGDDTPADAIFFMVGAEVPDDAAKYISEDDGTGVKIVFGCYPHKPDLYNKAHIFAPGDSGPAVSSEDLEFYHEDLGLWHTVRIDYYKEMQLPRGLIQ